MESNSHRYLGHNQNRDDNHQKPNERRQQNWVVHDIRNSAQKKTNQNWFWERAHKHRVISICNNT